MPKGTLEEFAQGIRDLYATQAEQIIACVQKGEWYSDTVNLTLDPEGEGPVISRVTFAGTTPEHAKRVQSAVAGAFLDLNE